MFRVTMLLAFLVISLSPVLAGQCYGTSESWHTEFSSHSAVDAVAARAAWEGVCDELTASTSHEWAGVYTADYLDTGQVQFRWAPKTGFAAVWVGCFPGVNDTNYGTVARTPDGIRLRPRLQTRKPWRHSLSETLVFVRWGDRRYIVPRDQVKDFCDFVAGRAPYEPELGIGFLCHVADLEKPVADLPSVPAKYRSHVRPPIDARVTAISQTRDDVTHPEDEDQDVVFTVRLDKGSADGVERGMRFTPDAKWFAGWFTVTAVERRSSTAVLRTRVGRRAADGEAHTFQAFGSPIVEGTLLTNRPVLPEKRTQLPVAAEPAQRAYLMHLQAVARAR